VAARNAVPSRAVCCGLRSYTDEASKSKRISAELKSVDVGECMQNDRAISDARLSEHLDLHFVVYATTGFTHSEHHDLGNNRREVLDS
jgi:hypothetical protein